MPSVVCKTINISEFMIPLQLFYGGKSFIPFAKYVFNNIWNEIKLINANKIYRKVDSILTHN